MKFILDSYKGKAEALKPNWEQGYFSFGDKKRVATVTDVKFIDSNFIVAAHRAEAFICLFKIEHGTLQIIDTLSLVIDGNVFNPDLLAVSGDVIYMTSYTRELGCVYFSRESHRLVFKETITVDEKERYHGCFADNKNIFVGGVNRSSDHASLTVMDPISKSTHNLLVPGNCRVMAIGKYEDYYVIGIDYGGGGGTFDAKIGLYRQSTESNHLTQIHCISLNKVKLDAIVVNQGCVYACVHSADESKGYILGARITKSKFTRLVKKEVSDFPHGIDCFNNQLVYCSYSNSMIESCGVDDFWRSASKQVRFAKIIGKTMTRLSNLLSNAQKRLLHAA